MVGLALPRQEIEFDLTYYNTNTFWIDIDRLLACFDLSREDLRDQPKVDTAWPGAREGLLLRSR